ncbi:MAG: hypothetical protein SGJ11_13915, partial [Phycisphaerae bacterium]|nr:hypothetical protein [Phycisphaerae bacterium]
SESRRLLATTGKEWVGGEKAAGFGGGGSGSGGSTFGEPSDGGVPTRMEKIDALAQLIMEQVDAESWKENAGALSAMNERDGVLLVRTSLKNHVDIRSLLELLRSVRPVGLQVDVAIVRVAPQRAASIRERAGERFPVIDGQVADELAFQDVVDGVLFRSTVGTRNGEAAWISDVTQVDIIAGQRAIVAQQSSEKTPIVGQVHSGLEVIALPLFDVDGTSATVDVQMAWKPVVEVMPAPQGETGIGAVDRTRQRMRTVSSQSRCKLGEAIVMSIPATPTDGGASVAHDDWLIVRVRAGNSRVAKC